MSSYVFQILANLTKREQKLFSAYIASASVKPNIKLIKLYEGISVHAPKYMLAQTDWEQIFEQMWPGRKFDKAELHSKMSLLFGLLKQFLSALELKEQKNQQRLLYLRQLRKRGLQDIFETETRKFEKQLDQVAKPSAEDFYYRYRLADEANFFYGQRQLREFDTSLQGKIDQLDTYYLHVRLRESCERLNRHQVLNIAYKPNFFDQWIERLNKEELQEPIWQIYLHILQCYQHPEEASIYQKLKSLLQNYGHLIDPKEAHGVYSHAQNYCIRRITVGKVAYLEELFELYQQQLHSGLIIQTGELDHSNYKNIVTLGLRLKKYDWVNEFMEKYRKLVSESYRDNVYHFCKADMLYNQASLKEAIRLLNTVTFTDIFYQISARILLIKLYFEMEEHEGLFYALDAFERFLRRDKSIAKERRESHRNFIICCRRLAKLRERMPMLNQPEFHARLQKLQLRMQEIGNISNLVWLEEKLVTP